MQAPGLCFDGDLHSWHGWWRSRTFLVGGCIDLVCQAEQHRILLAISVQLGRHSRALGVVCTSFFFVLFVGLGLGIGAWKVVGFWPLFHPVRGPFFLQALWREVLKQVRLN